MNYINKAHELYERGLDLTNAVGFHATSVKRFAKVIVQGKVKALSNSIPFHTYPPGLKRNAPEHFDETGITRPITRRYDTIINDIRWYAEGASFDDFIKVENPRLYKLIRRLSLSPYCDGVDMLQDIAMVRAGKEKDAFLRYLVGQGAELDLPEDYIFDHLAKYLKLDFTHQGIVFSFNKGIFKYKTEVAFPDDDDVLIHAKTLDLICINGFQFYRNSSMSDLEIAIAHEAKRKR